MTFGNLLFTVCAGRNGSGATPPRPQTAQFIVVPWLAAALLAGCGQGAPASDPAGGRNPGTHAAEGYGDAIASARALIDSLMEARGIPGMSVAVGQGSEVIWSEGFGYSDLTHEVRVTPETRFRIGSVSKPFTAAAVAHLVEDGALDLDAPVRTYVPSWPAKRWPVTTRQLAGHIGGVRHYRGSENFSMASYPDVLSGLAIFQDDSLISEPGTDYSYSSYGWNLISAVVEGASGEPFLDYMDAVVFGPLEMTEYRGRRGAPGDPAPHALLRAGRGRRRGQRSLRRQQLQVGGRGLPLDARGHAALRQRPTAPRGIWRRRPSSCSLPPRPSPMGPRPATGSAGAPAPTITGKRSSRIPADRWAAPPS